MKMTNAQRAGQIIYDEHQRCKRDGLRNRFDILRRIEARRPSTKETGIGPQDWKAALEEYKRTLLAAYLGPVELDSFTPNERSRA